MVETTVGAEQFESAKEQCQRARMRLALTLFDVEVAHALFMATEPDEGDYEERLRNLNLAIEAYRQMDRAVSDFLRDPYSPGAQAFAAVPMRQTGTAARSEREGRPVADQATALRHEMHPKRAGGGFSLFGVIGRVFGYQRSVANAE